MSNSEKVKGTSKVSKANTALADMLAPSMGSGSANLAMRLTLVKDIPNSRYNRPPQVQKILNYIEALGGTATVAEIMQLADVATGGNIWKRNLTTPYRQDVATVIEHYHLRLVGSVSWIKADARADTLDSAVAYVTTQ